MKTMNYHLLSEKELEERKKELLKEKFNFSFQKATGQLQNVARVRIVRRDIARVLTFLGQKKRSRS